MSRRFQFSLKWLFVAMLFVPTFYAGREFGQRQERERLTAEWAKTKEVLQDASVATETAAALQERAASDIEFQETWKEEQLRRRRARAMREGK